MEDNFESVLHWSGRPRLVGYMSTVHIQYNFPINVD